MRFPRIRDIVAFFRRTPGTFDAPFDTDTTFLDSSNLPEFDISQFEGRLEKPIPERSLAFLGAFFFLILAVFATRLWIIQVNEGSLYAAQSEENRFKHTLLFANRGNILDRNGTLLAWNDFNPDDEFSLRKYTPLGGFAHLLGYVNYPKRDDRGFYYQEEFDGIAGIERAMDDVLKGKNGQRIVEIDALGETASETVTEPPRQGESVTLSVDAGVQERLHTVISNAAASYGFQGGAGVIMDVETGEILALTSFPEFSPEVMTNGDTSGKSAELSEDNNPFLNRAISGLYTPGSIVKPFMAVAALAEHIIDPEKEIFSDGSLKLPNPYRPGEYTVFGDWRANGWTDMREAIAASSDVYFYVVGGGFGDQKGLGITNIDKYMRIFGFGSPTGIALEGEMDGTVPNPEWKKETFGEDWLLGNTYHTSIGQYGFQVTPLQAVRAAAALANGGTLVRPTVILGDQRSIGDVEEINLNPDDLQIAREGMRMVVTDPEFGTAKTVNSPAVKIAAKTGTAELGISKSLVNSWIIGFFPYEKPKYAFAVVMEKGSRTNIVGAPYVMRQLIDWMAVQTPEYFEVET